MHQTVVQHLLADMNLAVLFQLAGGGGGVHRTCSFALLGTLCSPLLLLRCSLCPVNGTCSVNRTLWADIVMCQGAAGRNACAAIQCAAQ